MSEKIQTMHSLRRTNPKGEKFIGECVLCGKKGLSIRDFQSQECDNPLQITQDEDLLSALEQPK
jgi:hypothetical protein